MLAYRERMKTDPEFKKSEDKKINKPIPKLQYFHIPVILSPPNL